MKINFYIKDSECVGYSDSDFSKAIEHDSVVVVEGDDINLDLPWKFENGEAIQLTLEEATNIIQHEE